MFRLYGNKLIDCLGIYESAVLHIHSSAVWRQMRRWFRVWPKKPPPPTPARARPPVPATNIAWQGHSPAGHFPVEKAPRISWKGKGNGHSRCYQSLRVITSYHNLLQSLSNHHWLLVVILGDHYQYNG